MSTKPQTIPIHQVSPDDTDSILKLSHIITKAFDPSPLLNAFVTEQDQIPPPYPATSSITFERRLEHFEPGISLLVRNGAVAVHAGDWSAVAIWVPPGYSGPSFGEARKKNSSLTEELKEKAGRVETRLFGTSTLSQRVVTDGDTNTDINTNTNVYTNTNTTTTTNLKPTWHLAFLARNPEKQSTPGAISAVIRPFLEKAREQNIPAWLDAINPRGVSIYEHFGFRVEEIISIGVGRVGEDGWPMEGGKGIALWVMVFDGHVVGR